MSACPHCGRRDGWAPTFRLLLRADRLLRAERQESASLRRDFALALAQRDAARDLCAAVVGESEPVPAWVDEAESWANGGGA